MNLPNATLQMRFDQLKESWNERPPREKLIIAVLAALVALALLWTLIWTPVNESLDYARVKLPAAKAALDAAQQRFEDARALPQTATKGLGDAKTAVQSAAERFAIASAISNISESGGEVSVTLSAVSFDTLVAWLSDLQNSEFLFVKQLTLTPLATPDQLRVEAVLARP